MAGPGSLVGGGAGLGRQSRSEPPFTRTSLGPGAPCFPGRRRLGTSHAQLAVFTRTRGTWLMFVLQPSAVQCIRGALAAVCPAPPQLQAGLGVNHFPQITVFFAFLKITSEDAATVASVGKAFPAFTCCWPGKLTSLLCRPTRLRGRTSLKMLPAPPPRPPRDTGRSWSHVVFTQERGGLGSQTCCVCYMLHVFTRSL